MRERRRRWLIAAAVAFVLALTALLGFAPLVRAQVRSRAQARGVVALIGGVRLGWGRIWLRDVHLSIPEVPAASATLPVVEVGLSAPFGAERIVVHGGAVDLRGRPEDLARQIAAWRGPREKASRAQRSGLAYQLRGVTVTWREADGGSDAEQHVWGLSYLRAPDGREALSADRVQIRYQAVSADLDAPRLTLRREEGRRVVERLEANGASVTVQLDELPGWGHTAGAPTAGERKKEKQARPFKPDAKRGPELRRRLLAAVAVVENALPAPSELELAGLRLELRHGSDRLRLGPAHLSLDRKRDRVELSLVPGEAQRTPLTLRFEAPLGPGKVKVALEGGPVSLAALGVQEGDLGLLAVDRAKLEARVRLSLSADGKKVGFDGEGRLTGLSIKQRWLARQALEDLALQGTLRGEAALDGSRLRVDQGKLRVREVEMSLAGEFERRADGTRARVEGGLPLASCQAALDALPRGLAPLLEGLRLAGTISLDTKVAFDTARPRDVTLDWNLRNECRVNGVSPAIDPRRFSAPWTRRVLAADRREVSIESGPGTPDWVPLSAISRHMETGVLVCEDARFWRHDGFDQEAIENSIRENIKARGFVRGASTISMQLAKNLYLTREKTLSRKLQEAALTMLLEQQLTKAELLELYLNVIEFGPGIYGVGPAARHYFNTTAADLSLGQALYLASILPNPYQQHFGPDGLVSERWSDYLRRLMRIANKIRRVTDAELEEGLREQVAYGVPYVEPEVVLEPEGSPETEERDPSQAEGTDSPQPPAVSPSEPTP